MLTKGEAKRLRDEIADLKRKLDEAIANGRIIARQRDDALKDRDRWMAIVDCAYETASMTKAGLAIKMRDAADEEQRDRTDRVIAESTERGRFTS